ncbi:uncharacterized protein METZ01_LOCUS416035, partial [marine metagenome]
MQMATHMVERVLEPLGLSREDEARLRQLVRLA